jgi:hypothetical protein
MGAKTFASGLTEANGNVYVMLIVSATSIQLIRSDDHLDNFLNVF